MFPLIGQLPAPLKSKNILSSPKTQNSNSPLTLAGDAHYDHVPMEFLPSFSSVIL